MLYQSTIQISTFNYHLLHDKRNPLNIQTGQWVSLFGARPSRWVGVFGTSIHLVHWDGDSCNLRKFQLQCLNRKKHLRSLTPCEQAKYTRIALEYRLSN